MAENQELFREMSKPFESQDSADAAINAFFHDLGELRKKHKLTNLYCIISGSYVDQSGEHQFLNNLMYGDQSLALELTAFAFGAEKVSHQQNVERMLEGGMKSRRRTTKES